MSFAPLTTFTAVEEPASTFCLRLAAQPTKNHLVLHMFWEKEGEKAISNSQLVNILGVDEVQIIAFPMLLYLFATCSTDYIPTYADTHKKPLEKQFQ